jgi:DNA-binding NarL/FixJ family response regulator
LAQGLSNDRIAQQTRLSEAMVRTYLSEIYRKMGLSGRDAAVQYAREHGFGDEGGDR